MRPLGFAFGLRHRSISVDPARQTHTTSWTRSRDLLEFSSQSHGYWPRPTSYIVPCVAGVQSKAFLRWFRSRSLSMMAVMQASSTTASNWQVSCSEMCESLRSQYENPALCHLRRRVLRLYDCSLDVILSTLDHLCTTSPADAACE